MGEFALTLKIGLIGVMTATGLLLLGLALPPDTGNPAPLYGPSAEVSGSLG